MTIDIARLRAKWGWSTLFSILPFAVMGWLDGAAKAAAGFGVLDLQFAGTEAKTRQVLDAWSAAGVGPQIGFSLGVDYLYMLLYAFALFYGAVAAREAFAREPGGLRRFLTLAACAGPVAALIDVVENAIHAGMLFGTMGPDAVSLSYPITLGKWALVVVALLLALAGLVGLLTGRLKKA